MGFWGPAKKPTARHAQRRISLGSISYGHSPDKRKANQGLMNREGPPIDVERTWGGGYRVIDGNDRVYWARRAGRGSIVARVWD